MERQKLEAQDSQQREFWERQRDRFRLMHALLNELVASISTDYLETHIGDDSARIEVGKKSYRAEFETDIQWKIEPNHIMYTQEKPGFRVEETKYYNAPEMWDVGDKEERALWGLVCCLHYATLSIVMNSFSPLLYALDGRVGQTGQSV